MYECNQNLGKIGSGFRKETGGMKINGEKMMNAKAEFGTPTLNSCVKRGL